MTIEDLTYKDRIIHAYAEEEYKTLSRKIIKILRSNHDIPDPGEYGYDDSRCENAWNAVCVRAIQGECEAPYDEYACTAFQELIKTIPEYVLSAMWSDVDNKDLAAFQEEEMVFEVNDHRGNMIDIKGLPYITDDIFRHLWEEYILPTARNYSNKNIREAIDILYP